jgi:hypothetical protein
MDKVIKEMAAMPMHTTVNVDGNTSAQRVPGGWIYTHWYINDSGRVDYARDTQYTNTFVPMLPNTDYQE